MHRLGDALLQLRAPSLGLIMELSADTGAMCLLGCVRSRVCETLPNPFMSIEAPHAVQQLRRARRCLCPPLLPFYHLT